MTRAGTPARVEVRPAVDWGRWEAEAERVAEEFYGDGHRHPALARRLLSFAHGVVSAALAAHDRLARELRATDDAAVGQLAHASRRHAEALAALDACRARLAEVEAERDEARVDLARALDQRV